MRGSDSLAAWVSQTEGVLAVQVYRESRRSASSAGDTSLYPVLTAACDVARLCAPEATRITIGGTTVHTLKRDDGAILVVAHPKKHAIVKSVNRLLRRRLKKLSPSDPPLTTSCFTG